MYAGLCASHHLRNKLPAKQIICFGDITFSGFIPGKNITLQAVGEVRHHLVWYKLREKLKNPLFTNQTSYLHFNFINLPALSTNNSHSHHNLFNLPTPTTLHHTTHTINLLKTLLPSPPNHISDEIRSCTLKQNAFDPVFDECVLSVFPLRYREL